MEKSQVELLLFFIEITLESRQMNLWKKWIHENLKFMKKMSFRNYESSSDVKFLVCWKLKIHEKNEFSKWWK